MAKSKKKTKPASDNAIEAEAIKVTGLERKPKETDAKWRGRVARALSKLEDDEWDELSEELQEWGNAAVKAVKGKKSPAAFPEPGDEEEDEEEEAEAEEDEDEDEEEEEDDDDEEEDDDDEEEEDEPEPKKGKGKKAAASKGKGKGKGKKAPPARKQTGAVAKVRELIVRNPDKNKGEIVELAESKEIETTPSTINTVYFHTHQTIELVRKFYRLSKKKK